MTLPVWLLLAAGVAIFIKVSSPGPVIFAQERTGLGERHFTMFKFRTMTVDAEKDGPRFAAADDPRLIRGGSWLRKSRLDEIPQLWNVLKGDMSLVGPRAEQVSFARDFAKEIPFYSHRHMVRPGVTGWAQVNYGYADDQADTIEKLTYDLYYIKNMSPIMDLKVLWESVWTVLNGQWRQVSIPTVEVESPRVPRPGHNLHDHRRVRRRVRCLPVPSVWGQGPGH